MLELQEAILENAPWYIGGAVSLAIGVFLLMDDVGDLGRTIYEGHPSPAPLAVGRNTDCSFDFAFLRCVGTDDTDTLPGVELFQLSLLFFM